MVVAVAVMVVVVAVMVAVEVSTVVVETLMKVLALVVAVDLKFLYYYSCLASADSGLEDADSFSNGII